MFLGEDGFLWWVGVVEDVSDPLLIGRARVRIFGYHPQYKIDENENPENAINRLPISELPWAMPILPLNTPNAYGKLNLGEWVFGFFLDGRDAQEPAILGYIPSVPPYEQPTVGDLFGKYGSNVRTFNHVYDKNEEFRSQDFSQPSKEYSRRLNRYSFKTSAGHLFELIDDVSDLYKQEVSLANATGSKLKMTADHLGNHDLTLSEAGGQNITLSTTSAGARSINISHPTGASISISPDGSIVISAAAGKDIQATGSGGSYSLTEKIKSMDVQIDIAKTLPVAAPAPPAPTPPPAPPPSGGGGEGA